MALFRLLLGPLGLSIALVAAAPPVRAEPEVRILLRERVPQVALEGRAVTIVVDGGAPLRVRSGRVTVRAREGGLRVEGRDGRRVVVTGKGALEVGERPYLGRMEIVAEAGRLTLVNRLPTETYLLGIVGSEMPSEWPVEALKAQAVAARTYALQRRLGRRAGGYAWDLKDSVLSQVYRGAASISESVIEAVRATRGEVLTFRHEPAETLFHSTCGGHTVPAQAVFGGDVPYLVRRDCEWCRSSPRYRWTVELDRSEVGRLLERAGLARGLRRIDRSGEEAELFVRDRRGRRPVSPTQLRSAVGYGRVYSTRFSVDARGARVRLDGAGFGHRVGLCQWGARGMAAEGRSYRAILSHYYDGSDLKRAY